jgi:hypothetical protein
MARIRRVPPRERIRQRLGRWYQRPFVGGVACGVVGVVAIFSGRVLAGIALVTVSAVFLAVWYMTD